MVSSAKRLSQQKLHTLFLEDIGEYADNVIDTGRKPLCFRLLFPFNRDIKAYVFNCTADGGGGRTIDEFKVQLILDGQRRGHRGSFDVNDRCTILIVGYAVPFLDEEKGIWILFEVDKHQNFAYSANIQVYLRQMLQALDNDVYVCKKNNHEMLVLSQRCHLLDALSERFKIDLNVMLEKVEHESSGT